jgi:anti-sigma factor RsiW
VSCSRVRRELLEHFRFPNELGSRSEPHLTHLESCAACRREVGIDRELVRQLRQALRERVEGSAPSAASWDQIRRRTVDRPARPWTMRVLRWGGLLPAAVAGTMMLATVSETGLLNGTHAPVPVTASAEQAVALVEGASSSEPPLWVTYRAQRPVPQPPAYTQSQDEIATSVGEMPPIVGRLQ